jgi:hypothetical protein
MSNTKRTRALSVLSEGIEGLWLEAFYDPTVYFSSLAAGHDLVSGVSVEDSFEQHPHNNLQIDPATRVSLHG